MLTALTIIRTLKSDRNRVLWINHERREAALSPAADSACVPVDYSEAKIARTDTSLRVECEQTDGEIISAI